MCDSCAIKVEYELDSELAAQPYRAKDGDSGFDLRSIENSVIPSKSFRVIKTGVHIALPSGCEAQIRSRSGLAAKRGLFVLNSPGTIDNGYRGELCVIMANLGDEDAYIYAGDRIAQLVVQKINAHLVSFVNRAIDHNTNRSDDGLGSTGTK